MCLEKATQKLDYRRVLVTVVSNGWLAPKPLGY